MLIASRNVLGVVGLTVLVYCWMKDLVEPTGQLVGCQACELILSVHHMGKQDMNSDIMCTNHTTKQEMRYISEHSQGRTWWLVGIAAISKDVGLKMYIIGHVLSHFWCWLIPKALSSHSKRAGKSKEAVNVKCHLRLHCLCLLFV